jgi:hypothetical protein
MSVPAYGSQGRASHMVRVHQPKRSEGNCMNVLPTPPSAVAKAHCHKGIETIAYMLDGECTFITATILRGKCWCARASSGSLPPTYSTHRATRAGNRAHGS